MKKVKFIIFIFGIILGSTVIAGFSQSVKAACSTDSECTWMCPGGCTSGSCSSSCNVASATCSSTCNNSCVSWNLWSGCSIQSDGQCCRTRRCSSNNYDYEIDCSCGTNVGGICQITSGGTGGSPQSSDVKIRMWKGDGMGNYVPADWDDSVHCPGYPVLKGWLTINGRTNYAWPQDCGPEPQKNYYSDNISSISKLEYLPGAGETVSKITCAGLDRAGWISGDSFTADVCPFGYWEPDGSGHNLMATKGTIDYYKTVNSRIIVIQFYVDPASKGTVNGRIYEKDGQDVITRGTTSVFGQAQCDNAQYLNKGVSLTGTGTIYANRCDGWGPLFSTTSALGTQTISIPRVGDEVISWSCWSPDGACPAATGIGNSLNINVMSNKTVSVNFYINAPQCNISGPTTVCSTQNLTAPLPNYPYSATAVAGGGVVNLGIFGTPTGVEAWNTLVHRAGIANSGIYSGLAVGAINQPAEFNTPGTYFMVCNAYGASGAIGTGNPFSLGPPWNNYISTNAGSSSRMTVTAQSALAGPTSVTVGQNPNYPLDGLSPIRVTWSAVTGASSYNIYRCNPTCPAIPTATGITTTSWIDPLTTLTCGVNYVYKVSPVTGTNLPECQGGSGQTGIGMCTVKEAWFGVRGGDVVAAGGGVEANLPVGMDKFIDAAVNGGSGVAIGYGITGLTSGNVSTKKWLVNLPNPMTNFLSKEENKFSYMRDRIISKMAPYVYNTSQSLTWNIDQAVGVGKTINGIAIMQSSGSVDSQTSGEDIGARKAVLIVNGKYSIKSNINLNDNAGFFLVLASGNIAVEPTVGVTGPVDIRAATFSPHIEGIYYAQGEFSTGHILLGGATDKQLRIDGTIVGMGGVLLQRNHVSMNPAEYVQYRPDLTQQLSKLGLRMKIVQELDNP